MSGLGRLATIKFQSNLFLDIFFGFIIVSLIVTFVHFFFHINFLISFIVLIIGYIYYKQNLNNDSILFLSETPQL